MVWSKEEGVPQGFENPPWKVRVRVRVWGLGLGLGEPKP